MVQRAQHLWQRLTAAVPGARVVKSGLVVALVWGLAQAMGQERPMFAVFAALGAMQPTVRSSALHLASVLAGVIVGSVLALAMTSAFGAPQAATMGIAVILALVLGYRLAPTSRSVGGEVLGTTVLTVAFANGQLSWIGERLVEVAAGGLLGVMVNALLLPPDYLSDVKAALHSLSNELAAGMERAIGDIVQRPSREVVRSHLAHARDARSRADALVATADKALDALHYSPMLRFSPFRRGRRDRVARYGAAVRTLATALEHMRTAQRAAWQARRRPALDEVQATLWLPLGDALTNAIRAYEALATRDEPGTYLQAHTAMQVAFALHSRALARHAATPGGVANVDRAAVLGEIEHVLEDLSEPLEIQSPNTTANTRPLPVLVKS